MSGCWLWTGYLDNKGYGRVHYEHVTQRMHRLAWRLLRGPLTPGLQLDHVCRTRSCCNPDHLREVTARQNTLAPGSLSVSAKRAALTQCPRGHAYSGANLMLKITPTGGQVRRCRACESASGKVRKIRYRRRLLAKAEKDATQ